jgi:hypothetical protein
MAIHKIYPNFQLKALQMTQNWDFWYENITSGNPGLPAMAFPVLLP